MAAGDVPEVLVANVLEGLANVQQVGGRVFADGVIQSGVSTARC